MEKPTFQTHKVEEINLRDLILTLWSAKWLILIIAVVTTCIAVAYALLTSPVYEAKAEVLPPTASDLTGYNMAHQLSGPALATVTGLIPSSDNRNVSQNAVPELTPHNAYNAFLRKLDSVNLRRDFFEKIYLPHHPETKTDIEKEALWKQLNKRLVITPPTTGSDYEDTSITLTGRDGKIVADWVNQYLKMAMLASKNQLLDDLKSAINSRLDSINDQITTLRQIAQTDRQNDILRLKGALALAQAIGLEVPPSSGNLITSYTGTTAYLKGAKALKAELKLLEDRTSDDPYIPQLSNLLKEQALLSKINFPPKDFNVITVDQPAIQPTSPIKPRKILIILIGVIGGLIVGVMVVLIMRAWRNV